MANETSDATPHLNGPAGREASASELRRANDRVRELTEELATREAALAKLQSDYNDLKHLLLAKFRELSELERPDLENYDLEQAIRDEGGLPLDAFIHELEEAAEGK